MLKRKNEKKLAVAVISPPKPTAANFTLSTLRNPTTPPPPILFPAEHTRNTLESSTTTTFCCGILRCRLVLFGPQGLWERIWNRCQVQRLRLLGSGFD
ncbi:hypothetical protein ACFX2J_039504 [Malus domestica]